MKYIRWPDVLSSVNWLCRHVDDPRAKAFVARTLPTFMLQRHHRIATSAHIDAVTAVTIAESLVRVKRHSGPLDARAAALLAIDEANMSKPFYDFVGAIQAVHLGVESFPIRSGPYVTEEDGEAKDWLNSLGDRDIDKLPRMTWQQAIDASERWHLAIRRRAERRATIAGDDGTADRIESADGHYWVRLTTQVALDREGDAMGNCVGRGGYDRYADGRPASEGGIWSLRDAKGRSVLTAEVSKTYHVTDDGYRGHVFLISQVSRFGNARTRPEDRPHVEALEAFYAGI